MIAWIRESLIGLRGIARRPGVFLVGVAALGLGIGASTTVFALLDAYVLRPLPIERPERVVLLWQSDLSDPERRQDVSPANFVDWRRRSRSFSALAAFTGGSFDLDFGGRPEPVRGMQVTGDFFRVLGRRTVAGRPFSEEETEGAGLPVIVLGRSLWERRFGGSPAVVGRTLLVEGMPRTVVGVVEDGWSLLPGAELWMPLGWSAEQLVRDDHYLQVAGRLAPDVGVAAAARELEAVADELSREHPEANAGYGIGLQRIDEVYPSRRDRRLLFILFGVVSIVLLIACADVANLQMARSTWRRTELAVRAVFGADRGRLMRPLLLEGVALGVVGALIGIALAFPGITLARSALLGASTHAEVAFDWRLLLFCLLIAVFAGVASSLLPAWFGARSDLQSSLQQATHGGSVGRGRLLVGRLLVGSQLALAVVAVGVAVLMISAFLRLRNADPGFRGDDLLTLRVGLPEVLYGADQFSEAERVTPTFREVYDRLAALPGVSSVGATTILPRNLSDPKTAFRIVGAREVVAGQAPVASWRAVSEGYFRTLGVPLVRGRGFTDDDRFGQPPVVVINRALARRYFPQADPLQAKLEIFDAEREVVGIVEDVLEGRGNQAPPAIYLPHAQSPRLDMALVIRAAGDAGEVLRRAPSAVAEVLPDVPVVEVRTFQEHNDQGFSGAMLIVRLLTSFSLLTLLLALGGVYGLVAYTTTRRMREFGIRLALGARRGDVLRLVLREVVVLTAGGLAVGVLLFVLTRQGIGNLLGGLFDFSWPFLAGVVAVLAATATLAALVPSWRATRADPALALRAE